MICKLECVQCPFSEMPVLFKQELQNQEAKEGKQIKLTCELSKPDTPVKWMKGGTVLYASEKYEFKQHGTVAELIIRDVTSIDAGDYTCTAGELKTTAQVKVHGKQRWVHCSTFLLCCSIEQPSTIS